MANPAQLPAVIEESAEEQVDEKIATALRDELLNEFLADYASKAHPPTKLDRIEQYIIQLNQPLPEFDTKLSKAYAVLDEAHPTREMYAMVCPRNYPARRKMAAALRINKHPNLIPLVTDGVVRLSNPAEERYVIIYERPKGKRLSEVLAEQSRGLSERFIIQKIIEPLADALNHIEEKGFTHGRVNPDNIYFGTQITLGECCSEPCGYSQDFRYELASRLQAHPAGKGEGTSTHDYYALGVLATFIKFKPNIFNETNPDRYILRLLQEGAYLALVGYRDLSEDMTDLLRGTLNDSLAERWTYKHIKPWAAGKRYNLLPPTIAGASQRPFELDEHERYSNLRILAQGLYTRWSLAVKYLRDGSLARWIELSARRKEICDNINRIVKSYGAGGPSPKAVNDMVSRCLCVMDIYAPMRLQQQLSVHIDGIGTLFLEIYNEQDEKKLNVLADMIENTLYNFCADTQRKIFNDKPPIPTQNMIYILDRSRLFLRTPGLGFGLERLLYDLNPELSCQSPLLKEYYITEVKQLVEVLDRLSHTQARYQPPLDKHIAAFIASRTTLTKNMAFNDFKKYPELVNNQALLALKFLQQAQARAKDPRLPGLSAWIGAGVMDVLRNFHSESIRSQMVATLKPICYSGHLNPLLNFLQGYDYAGADVSGFQAASQQYAMLNNGISELQDDRRREWHAKRVGSGIAKTIAYTGLLIVMYYLFAEG